MDIVIFCRHCSQIKSIGDFDQEQLKRKKSKCKECVKYHVYMIFNLINGKIYIGRTENLIERWKEHRKCVRLDSKESGRYLIHKAMLKYGEDNFEFRIVQELNSFKEMKEAEIYWISFYQTNAYKYGKNAGYNLTDGSDGEKWSEERRQKLSKSRMGFRHPTETRLKMSRSKAKLTIEQLKQIRQLLLDNVSMYEIANQFNITQSVVADMKRGKSHRYFFTDEDVALFAKRTTRQGERNSAAKLTEDKVREIRVLLAQGIPATTIAAQYGVGQSTILRIKTGQCWAFVK